MNYYSEEEKRKKINSMLHSTKKILNYINNKKIPEAINEMKEAIPEFNNLRSSFNAKSNLDNNFYKKINIDIEPDKFWDGLTKIVKLIKENFDNEDEKSTYGYFFRFLEVLKTSKPEMFDFNDCSKKQYNFLKELRLTNAEIKKNNHIPLITNHNDSWIGCWNALAIKKNKQYTSGWNNVEYNNYYNIVSLLIPKEKEEYNQYLLMLYDINIQYDIKRIENMPLKLTSKEEKNIYELQQEELQEITKKIEQLKKTNYNEDKIKVYENKLEALINEKENKQQNNSRRLNI